MCRRKGKVERALGRLLWGAGKALRAQAGAVATEGREVGGF